MAHHQIDARRLLCPMPVIRVQDRVAELDAGDMLELHATDPGVHQDVPAWCRVHGHEIVETREDGGEIVITIRIAGGV
ncbi:MAG: sulfurtransferase TusA family protein [Gammaproteobacteria bacterium]|nr:sulfurtransferase TusA family protein [Gammaproteobacteria bacterium]NIR88611.1 sulfurtransferase TusA family protein [Gammaproteobacteria bacterium]